MYINFRYLKENGMNAEEVLYLQIVKQLPSENYALEELERLSKKYSEGYFKEELIEYNKGKAKDPKIIKTRLSKKGKELLKTISSPFVEEEDVRLFEWIKEQYIKMDKQIGNQSRIKKGISEFRVQTNIEKNKLALLLRTFLMDRENMKYNNKLENVFFSNSNVFSVRFNLEECRLYDYYLRRKEAFDARFKEIEEKDLKTN